MRTLLIIVVILVIEARGDTSDHPHGKPFNVLSLSDDQTIAIDTKSIDEIFSHEEVKDRKMIVVSIIGALRKGKSFFLDYCLRFMYAKYKSVNYRDNALDKPDWMGLPDEPLHGFSWKAGPHRHTTGIVFWSDVFLYEKTLKDGRVEKYAILLIDTQGLFDTTTSPADNSRIFALGTLLSSVQIFNLNDVVQENQLEYLHLATEYATFVTSNSKTTQVKPFQNLLFLMRDWPHESSYKYGSGGGNEYLHTVLQIKDEQSQELKDVRKYIRESFDNVNCFLMPHPGLKVTTNSNFDGRLSELDAEFKKQLKEVIEWLLSPEYLVKKRVLDVEVTGTELSAYIKSYFEIFQSPETPKIQSIYEVTTERQLALLVDKAMKLYKEGFNNYTEYSHPEFAERMQEVQEKAKAMTLLGYDAQRKMGSREHVEKFRKMLAGEIDLFYTQWIATALETRQKFSDINAANEKEVSRLNENLNNKLKAQNESFAEEMRKQEAATLGQIEDIKSNMTLKQEEKDAMIKQIQDKNEVLVHEAQEMQKQVQAKEKNGVMDMVAEITKAASAELSKILMMQKGSDEAAAARAKADRDMLMETFRKQEEQRREERKEEQKARREEDKKRQDQIDFLKAQMTEQSKAQAKAMEAQMQQENERRREEAQRRDAERKDDLIRRQQERKESSIQFQKQMELMQANNKRNSSTRISAVSGIIMSASALMYFVVGKLHF